MHFTCNSVLPLVLLLLAACRETLTDNNAPNPQSVAVLTQQTTTPGPAGTTTKPR